MWMNIQTHRAMQKWRKSKGKYFTSSKDSKINIQNSISKIRKKTCKNTVEHKGNVETFKYIKNHQSKPFKTVVGLASIVTCNLWMFFEKFEYVADMPYWG